LQAFTPNKSLMKNISIIGSGTMGNGIAHTFAQHGYTVSLVDISKDMLERGLATISTNLDRMVEKGKITEQDKNNTLSNIQLFDSMAEGVKNADLVVEAASENWSIKSKIF
jgi:3-hydroxybutyryl-CoA dehydrogenase